MGADLKHTESVTEGNKPSRVSDATFEIDGRTVIGYYKDSAFTEAFDFNAAITADTNVYVKLSDKVYPVYTVNFYVGTEIKYTEKVTEGGKITAQAIKEVAPELERAGITFVTVSELAK